MNTLTPEQKKKVAQEVIPNSPEYHDWCINDEGHVVRGLDFRSPKFDPGVEGYEWQFKALAVWCFNHNLEFEKTGEKGEELYSVSKAGIEHDNFKGGLYADSDVSWEEAMQAAVLAFKENEDG